ncbi:cation diffusion facilitator family transporter [Mycobacterium nebraskense]|uniref:cation diffusion facilitator family transporter n=1 Tax=Mycobacterium nebraskense TaxID=244292 RepID=UPI0039C9DB91
MCIDCGHGHVSIDSDQRWLAGALAVIVAFMLGEVVVGIAASSLALISDAAHMLTDAASIMLALWAIRHAARRAAGRMTYGWKRVEILSAQANGPTLLLLGAWLGHEAIRRLIHPPEVTGALVLITALVGVVVNIAATWMISRATRTGLNVEGAFQHILTDLFTFIATAVAGVIILIPVKKILTPQVRTIFSATFGGRPHRSTARPWQTARTRHAGMRRHLWQKFSRAGSVSGGFAWVRAR